MKALVFDFGGVLVNWNPHHLYDSYFGSEDKATWFLENICTNEWNSQMDGGKPFHQGIAELTAKYPEYAQAIDVYYTRWIEMMGNEIEGMYELLQEYKAQGLLLLGLTNWSTETFCQVRDTYPIFKLMDGMVVSAEEHCIKPFPEIYRILLERFGLNACDCVFIDDRLPNVKGAEAVGMTGVLFTGAQALRAKLDQLLDRRIGSDN